jgi:hypothetical protein
MRREFLEDRVREKATDLVMLSEKSNHFITHVLLRSLLSQEFNALCRIALQGPFEQLFNPLPIHR